MKARFPNPKYQSLICFPIKTLSCFCMKNLQRSWSQLLPHPADCIVDFVFYFQQQWPCGYQKWNSIRAAMVPSHSRTVNRMFLFISWSATLHSAHSITCCRLVAALLPWQPSSPWAPQGIASVSTLSKPGTGGNLTTWSGMYVMLTCSSTGNNLSNALKPEHITEHY